MVDASTLVPEISPEPCTGLADIVQRTGGPAEFLGTERGGEPCRTIGYCRKMVT